MPDPAVPPHVTNTVAGSVSGLVVQAGAVRGGVHLHLAPERRTGGPLGRPITEVSPSDLEVHHAATPGADALTGYVVRAHDHRLTDLVAAALGPASESGLAVLVSESTAGKTRALFEALRRRVHLDPDTVTSLLEAGWRVWPGIAPAPARRFLAELGSVGPKTVIWLDEAQRYLVDPDHEVASAIASALRERLADPGHAPVLVLGTLWPRYLNLIAGRPRPGRPDRFADARLLLAGRTWPVPGAFTGADLEAARRSRDVHVRRAVEFEDAAAGGAGRATRIELTQVIAGVPALVNLRNTASATERAVLRAAMDARRLGHGEWLPVELLHHAAPAYLTDAEQRRSLSRPDWFAEALDALTTELAGSARALERPPVFAGRPPPPAVRLHDHLDQFGRRTRAYVVPPQRFWDAVLDHAADPDDRYRLGVSAHRRHRSRIAHGLWRRAAAAGVAGARDELSYYAGETEDGREPFTRGSWSVMEEILSSGGVRIFTPACWAQRTSTCDLVGCPDEADGHLGRAAGVGGGVEGLFADLGFHRHEDPTTPGAGADLARRVLLGEPDVLRLASRFGLEADGSVAEPWDDGLDPELRHRPFPDPPDSGPGNDDYAAGTVSTWDTPADR
ncbi:hypothetical protein [Saccharothrix xinjiangensis]|uniref:AAA domain-containing protein n=1 Tax=Saccharothrix xinjiangensis TaxID=204798 RepID=A0ABV9Y6N8_9PSEU